MIEPVSNGSPAFCHAFINLFAVTLLPKSFAPCFTAPAALPAAPATAPLAFPAAPLTAPPTLLAKLPKPRFAFAPSVQRMTAMCCSLSDRSDAIGLLCLPSLQVDVSRAICRRFVTLLQQLCKLEH